MHYAVHRHTAAELIVERADANKEHMGLTTWENAPDGKILKADVSIAKNYLSKEEMNYLERIVSLYLDYAELQARGVDTLYHDLDERPGSKFATTDLIGIPWQVVIGPKGLAAGQFEVKRRADGTREMLSPDEVLNRLG